MLEERHLVHYAHVYCCELLVHVGSGSSLAMSVGVKLDYIMYYGLDSCSEFLGSVDQQGAAFDHLSPRACAITTMADQAG